MISPIWGQHIQSCFLYAQRSADRFQPAIHINMSLVFEFASGIRCSSEVYSTEFNKDSVMNPRLKATGRNGAVSVKS